ncbi:MAG: methyltransferase domain-containing protein [Verrucomicrobia bacterium]|nr:methyltransferase domain-containing protein [Verrucomicrobiota bacterium]
MRERHIEDQAESKRIENRAFAPSGNGSGRVSRLQEAVLFFRTFARSPATVASLCPSSRALALALVREHEVPKKRVVVELGPGTGAITRVVKEFVPPEGLFLALELDGEAVRFLREQLPEVHVYHASAERLGEFLERHGEPHADSVISGLPWTLMPPNVQERIMQEVKRVLRPGGVFTTFTYFYSPLMPGARAYFRLLKRLFPNARISRIVFRNMPPAMIYKAVA